MEILKKFGFSTQMGLYFIGLTFFSSIPVNAKLSGEVNAFICDLGRNEFLLSTSKNEVILNHANNFQRFFTVDLDLSTQAVDGSHFILHDRDNGRSIQFIINPSSARARRGQARVDRVLTT